MSKKHYVNNKLLQEEMIKYQQSLRDCASQGKEEPRASDYIGKCILDIANRYSTKPKFYSYSKAWKDEMIPDGIENCIKYGLKNYNPEKFFNPLAYFTEIIHWSFVRRIKREKKEQYKKLKCQIDNELLEKLASNKYMSNENEIADHLIKDFEAKMIEDKKKRNVKKGIELFIE